MAGKRCIECFMLKKTKKPELVQSTESPLSIHEGPVDLWPTNIEYAIADTHTMTSTSATADDGTIRRTYKVTYPRFDLSVDHP